MPSTDQFTQMAEANPIDLLEEVILHKDWAFNRYNDSELAVEVPGKWADYSAYFAWSADHGAIHLSCAYDLMVPRDRRVALYELLAKINEKLWLGHFTLWAEEGLPIYRHSQFLRNADMPEMVIQDLLDVALGECDRFYPAFQFTVWGDKSAEEAIEASMLECMGEA